AAVTPITVRADSCQLEVQPVSAIQGVRAAVVDLTVPKAGLGHLSLTTSSAAGVDAGGGGGPPAGLGARGGAGGAGAPPARPAGGLGGVGRVAQKGGGGPVELDAWGEDGQPLAAHAPAPGAAASVTATSATAVTLGGPVSPAAEPERALLRAAALLALGEARE